MIAQVKPLAVAPEVKVLPDLEGMIQIFTAPHRSFFTNVVAHAIRTAAQGKSTLLIQFLKGGIGTGIENPVQLCQNLQWIRGSLCSCIGSSDISEPEKNEVLELWSFAKYAILSDQYAAVILDELSLAIEFGLVPEEECLTLLSQKPGRLDLVFTGPNMPESIVNKADQVTQIRRNLYI